MTSADLFAAIAAGDASRVTELLAGRPALAGASDSDGLSALTVAAYRAQWPIVEAIRAALPDLDVYEAAIVGDAERVALLVDESAGEAETESLGRAAATGGRQAAAGAEDGPAGDVRTAAEAGWTADARTVDERSPDGFTPLHLAAFFGRPEVVAVLLSRGADPNAWSAGGLHVQPLHSAVAGGHEQVARQLVAAGADVGSAQDLGYTPLMGAAAGGLAATVDLLLASGADPRARNADVLTAAELADRAGHPAIAARIRAATT